MKNNLSCSVSSSRQSTRGQFRFPARPQGCAVTVPRGDSRTVLRVDVVWQWMQDPISHSYKGRTWMTSALDALVLSLSSTDRDSSLVMIKMMEEELKVTFFFGLSPSFCDITMGLICISLSAAGRFLAGRWHLSSRKHRSCRRDLRNCREKNGAMKPIIK